MALNPDNNRKESMPEVKQLKMVGWYDPRLLARSGVEVAISTIFGRHSDHRLVEALGSGQKEFYDFTAANVVSDVREGQEAAPRPDKGELRQSIWIDYVGDVGDGWNSTYAVAYHIAAAHHLDEAGQELIYKDPDGEPHKVQKGEILVFGGDQVYPTASRESYEQRLIVPYKKALRCTKKPYPHIFAIPGNHDWYDSLVSFSRLFISRRWFGGWRTRQNRSYFAVKLPHNWWLLGTDVQLGSDIDRPQVAYFEWVAEQIEKETRESKVEARIILCHAEPHWISAALYENLDAAYTESNLIFLEKKLGQKVAVFIAGDLHHYRRHEALDGSTQKITAGGGGAFLHPTHPGLLGVNLEEIEERYAPEEEKECPDREPDDAPIAPAIARKFKKMACFPTEAESRRACWRNLIFPHNEGSSSRGFGILTAVLYLLTTLSLIARPEQWKDKFELSGVAAAAVYGVIASPFTLIWVLLIVLGFLLFTDTHSTLYRVFMGGAHAIAHVLAAFAVATLAIFAVIRLLPQSWAFSIGWGGYIFALDSRVLVASLLTLIGGFFIGPLVMGLYLLVSMNIFGRHANEAFSSIAIQDWKHFLKLHIDEAGDLTIYPVGIRRVPRKWKARAGEHGSDIVPDEDGKTQASEPKLIERPVRLARSKATPTGVITVKSNAPE